MLDVFYYTMIIFAMFLAYSFFGWVLEVVMAFVKEGHFVNRGFLIGPILPIWGAGVMLITLILRPDDSIFNLLVSSAFIGTFLEYVVNYLMEKLFKARWWDYSHLPFNINGRVWLGSSLLFGVGGLAAVKFINPFLYDLFRHIDETVLCVICGILFILLIIDFIVSCNIIQNLKLSAEAMRKDYTIEISKKVKAVLEKRSHAFRRLLKAFPHVKFNFKKKD